MTGLNRHTFFDGWADSYRETEGAMPDVQEPGA